MEYHKGYGRYGETLSEITRLVNRAKSQLESVSVMCHENNLDLDSLDKINSSIRLLDVFKIESQEEIEDMERIDKMIETER